MKSNHPRKSDAPAHPAKEDSVTGGRRMYLQLADRWREGTYLERTTTRGRQYALFAFKDRGKVRVVAILLMFGKKEA